MRTACGNARSGPILDCICRRRSTVGLAACSALPHRTKAAAAVPCRLSAGCSLERACWNSRDPGAFLKCETRSPLGTFRAAAWSGWIIRDIGRSNALGRPPHCCLSRNRWVCELRIAAGGHSPAATSSGDAHRNRPDLPGGSRHGRQGACRRHRRRACSGGCHERRPDATGWSRPRGSCRDRRGLHDADRAGIPPGSRRLPRRPAWTRHHH
jgi:hypothetical protein